MKKPCCHLCDKPVRAGGFDLIEIEIGGPSEGCEEFAAPDLIEVPVCKGCQAYQSQFLAYYGCEMPDEA